MTECGACKTTLGSVRDNYREYQLCGHCSGYGDLTLPEPTTITVDDVRAAKLDRDAFGHVFPEIKLAAALQVLRAIAKEQPTASAVVRALAQATLEKLA